jgi:MtN3 and saliva related transmembrane protein
MEPYNFIGYSGVLISSISLIPQICQIIKTKKVDDLNRSYFLLCIISEFLYISYGIIILDYVMILSTIPPMISQIIVIYLHCKYKNANIESSIDNE